MTTVPRFKIKDDKKAPLVSYIGVDKNGRLYIDGWFINSTNCFAEACEYLLKVAKKNAKKAIANSKRSSKKKSAVRKKNRREK